MTSDNQFGTPSPEGLQAQSRAIRRIDAKEAVKTMAAAGLSNAKIKIKLKKRGLDDALDRIEINAIAREARTALGLLPPPQPLGLIRMVGIAAILLGTGALLIGSGRGLWAIILGIILVLKPGWGNEEL